MVGGWEGEWGGGLLGFYGAVYLLIHVFLSVAVVVVEVMDTRLRCRRGYCTCAEG